MAFVLTKEHLASSVIKAIEEKRLGMFLPEKVRFISGCRYDYSTLGHADYQCAIGCALPESVRKDLIERGYNALPVSACAFGDYVTMDDDTRKFAEELQDMHDDIAQMFSMHDDSGNFLDEAEGIAFIKAKCEAVLRGAQVEA